MCNLAGPLSVKEFQDADPSIREQYPGAPDNLMELSAKAASLSEVNEALFFLFPLHFLSCFIFSKLFISSRYLFFPFFLLNRIPTFLSLLSQNPKMVVAKIQWLVSARNPSLVNWTGWMANLLRSVSAFLHVVLLLY